MTSKHQEEQEFIMHVPPWLWSRPGELLPSKGWDRETHSDGTFLMIPCRCPHPRWKAEGQAEGTTRMLKESTAKIRITNESNPHQRGGPAARGISQFGRKRYARSGNLIAANTSEPKCANLITFTEKNMEGVNFLHFDALILKQPLDEWRSDVSS